MRNVAAFYATKQAKPGFAKDKDRSRSARRSTAAASPSAACRPAPAATARTAPASRRSTRAWPASTPTTPTAQLVAFRAGARNNSPPMAGIAAKMNDREIKAVADYIAGLR